MKKWKLFLVIGILLLIMVFLYFFFSNILCIGCDGITEEILISRFTENFQRDVDLAWKEQSFLDVKEYSFETGIEKICFVDFSRSILENYNTLEISSKNNMFFLPFEDYGIFSSEIEHLNIAEITFSENPYCIDFVEGVFNLTIKKEFGENTIVVQR
jgi:hypothetical protein